MRTCDAPKLHTRRYYMERYYKEIPRLQCVAIPVFGGSEFHVNLATVLESGKAAVEVGKSRFYIKIQYIYLHYG